MIKVTLASVLEKREMTAYQVAKETGLAMKTVYDLAKQKGTRIDFKTLDLICKLLRCQPGDFLVFEDESTVNTKSDK